ncbi:MAG: hypothetical protein M0R06_10450 [Sphaerochaeta sp.]|jgi:hypothetical protein|nr:hypothetical protein [Sphaerochaeta sp.]
MADTSMYPKDWDAPWSSWGEYVAGLTEKARREEEERRKKKEEEEAAAAKQVGLTDFAESMPQGIYTSFLKGIDPAMSNYFGDKFYDFYNEYQGGLANEAAAGREPTQKFGGFLDLIKKELPGRYANLTSRQKGFYLPSAAPRTRTLNY